MVKQFKARNDSFLQIWTYSDGLIDIEAVTEGDEGVEVIRAELSLEVCKDLYTFLGEHLKENNALENDLENLPEKFG